MGGGESVGGTDGCGCGPFLSAVGGNHQRQPALSLLFQGVESGRGGTAATTTTKKKEKKKSNKQAGEEGRPRRCDEG